MRPARMYPAGQLATLRPVPHGDMRRAMESTEADLTFTDADMAKIVEWQKSFNAHECQICGNEEFTVLRQLMTCVGFTRRLVSPVLNQNVPMVVLYCKRCGHCLHFLASHIGLLNGEPPPEHASA